MIDLDKTEPGEIIEFTTSYVAAPAVGMMKDIFNRHDIICIWDTNIRKLRVLMRKKEV